MHSVLHQQIHGNLIPEHLRRASKHVEFACPSDLNAIVDISGNGWTHHVGVATYQYYPTHIAITASRGEDGLTVSIVVTPNYLHVYAHASDGRIGELRNIKINHNMGADIYNVIAPKTVVADDGAEQVITPILVSNLFNVMFESLYMRNEVNSEHLRDYSTAPLFEHGIEELGSTSYAVNALRTDSGTGYRFKEDEWTNVYNAKLAPELFDDATAFVIPEGVDDDELRDRLEKMLGKTVSPKTKESVAKHIENRPAFHQLTADLTSERVRENMRELVHNAERAYCYEENVIDNRGEVESVPTEESQEDTDYELLRRHRESQPLRPHMHAYQMCMNMLRRTPTRLTDGAEYIDPDAIKVWRALESTDDEWRTRWEAEIERIEGTNYANRLSQLDEDRMKLEDLMLEGARPDVFVHHDEVERKTPLFREGHWSAHQTNVLNHNNPFAHASTSHNTYTHISEEGVRNLRLTEVEQITHQMVDGQSLAVTKPSLRVIDSDIDIEIGDNILVEHRYKLEWRE